MSFIVSDYPYTNDTLLDLFLEQKNFDELFQLDQLIDSNEYNQMMEDIHQISVLSKSKENEQLKIGAKLNISQVFLHSPDCRSYQNKLGFDEFNSLITQIVRILEKFDPYEKVIGDLTKGI